MDMLTFFSKKGNPLTSYPLGNCFAFFFKKRQPKIFPIMFQSTKIAIMGFRAILRAVKALLP